jgi:hypothetical protein
MNILSKIKGSIYKIIYALPFGLKAADSEVFGTNSETDGHSIGIQQTIGQKRVAKDLLRGEETKEVSELRYRTYRVERESKAYDYLGNGVAVKSKENDKNYDLNSEIGEKFKFIQPNYEIVSSIEEELSRIGKYSKPSFTVECKYVTENKFQNEHFIKNVCFDNMDGPTNIILQYNLYINPYNTVEKIFHGNLIRAINGEVLNNDSVCDFKNISFTTKKAIGIEDYMEVSINDMQFDKISEDKNKGYIDVFYTAKNASINFLLTKYYNKEMSEKYKNKEKKYRSLSYSK